MEKFYFGYKVGRVVGNIFLYSIYILGIVAIIMDVLDKQLPVMPIILLFVFGTWRRVVRIETYLDLNDKVTEKLLILDTLNKNKQSNLDADKIMKNINNKFGGPN
jgi:hypothetical protein